VSEPLPRSVPLPSATAAYRIVQEPLSNATKYALEAPVTITLTAEQDCLRLMISDTGPGFDPVNIRTKGGLGMISMQERARLVGDDLQIQSQPGKGTTISLEISLAKPVNGE